ncbi:hypothetical protein P879_00290 [Paragonimus westermani]|uniref:Erythrocyte membrane protein band 4.1 n=1 Tax=Paragonimus westermani TaxID=34504 RepID=A0A8T0DU09_9TREM|nr:hypothetical protein P879_00290 [Paragonimus westermani]
MSENGSAAHNDYTFNHTPSDSHQVHRLEDGTIEVTDTLSKQEYYRSLRRPLDRQADSPGLASQLSLDLGHSGPWKSGLIKKNGSSLDYKPSGHEVICHVLMLEGVEKTFSIDRNAYGAHLFEKICKELDLRETEYFGLTYRSSPRTDYWLKMDKRLSKQLEKQPWKLEFHVRHYPLDIDEFKDDLTRYCLCLQIRQDVISGLLSCSFQTYVILGAYAVQSEAGDFDPSMHTGIEYISNMPFAPQSLQTPQMLQRIVELHKAHKGQTPEQADRGFLENARRLALYGVEFHKARTPLDEEVTVGLYHSGILVYRGRIRIGRFLWQQLIRLTYKSKIFSMSIRAVNITPRIRAAFLLKINNNVGAGGGLLGTRRKAVNSMDDELHQICTLNFDCRDARLAKRLWESCTSQHTFFRLRDAPGPQRANLVTGFNTRKYHYSDKTLSGSGMVAIDPDWPGRPQPRINRVKTQRKPAQYVSSGLAPVAFNEDPDKFYIIPGSPAPLPADAVDTKLFQEMPPAYRRPGPVRTHLAQEYWRMSPADCTPGLGMNIDGTDVAAMADADWQGCRTNRGVLWPGAYFYEAMMLEEGPIRLGWSTNDANLILGTDCKGFGYGIEETGGSIKPKLGGQFFHGNLVQEYGLRVVPGDVIGCFLEMGDSDSPQLTVQWSHNGRMLGPAAFTTPYAVAVGEPLFPAASLKDARVAFNFGYKPFRFPPRQNSATGSTWTPVANALEVNRVSNRNMGWRVNPADVSSNTNLLISPNGRMVQAVANTGWQGFRVNKGIFGSGKYYYEVKVMEDSGLARIGWSLDGANLDLGLDPFGYGFGADRDGFGITGTQGKKVHADIIENYGEAFGKDDVIGCFLDLDTGVIQWSKNGRLFGNAYWLPEQLLKQCEPIFPAASLVDTTLELNYGDLPFEYPPEDIRSLQSPADWLPMYAAPDANVVESSSWQNLRSVDRYEHDIKKSSMRIEHSRMRPEPPKRTSSRLSRGLDSGASVPISIQDENGVIRTGYPDSSSPDEVYQEDEVHTFTEKDGEDFPSDSHTEVHGPITTQSLFTQATTDRTENELSYKPNGITASIAADRALNAAIFETTHLNPDAAVLTESVGMMPGSNGCA